MIQLHSIFRYPIKGLQGEELLKVSCQEGKSLYYDRAWALIHKNEMPQGTKWLSKSNFYHLVNSPMLAFLQACYHDDYMTLKRKNKKVTSAKIEEDVGKDILEGFFRNYLHVMDIKLYQSDMALTDSETQYVSFLNTETLKHINQTILEKPAVNSQNRLMEMQQLRGNFIIDHLPAWQEREWIGKKVRIGKAVFEICDNIDRCAATNVNIATGKADCNLPQHLRKTYGHIDCGVFARIIEKGEVEKGAEIIILS